MVLILSILHQKLMNICNEKYSREQRVNSFIRPLLTVISTIIISAPFRFLPFLLHFHRLNSNGGAGGHCSARQLGREFISCSNLDCCFSSMPFVGKMNSPERIRKDRAECYIHDLHFSGFSNFFFNFVPVSRSLVILIPCRGSGSNTS